MADAYGHLVTPGIERPKTGENDATGRNLYATGSTGWGEQHEPRKPPSGGNNGASLLPPGL